MLDALGAPDAHADLVGRSLVESDLRGHGSHGVRRLIPYARQITDGTLDPTAFPTTDPDTPPGLVLVDGRNGFGQVTATTAAGILRQRATETTIACAVLRRCQHVGRLGEYVEALAAAGMVGIGFANADPTVAAWGGRDRMLGTNPTAWAVPVAAGAAPFVVDFATSATAEGKLAVARDRGDAVPTGLLVDPDGNDSADPEDFYRGGALLPFGGHKGYGLSAAFDLVAGVLSGVGSASSAGYTGGFGTVLIALRVATLVDLDTYVAEVEAFRDRIRRARPRPGTDRVLVPGEPEWAARQLSLRDGIAVADTTLRHLERLAAELQVPGPAHPDREETP